MIQPTKEMTALPKRVFLVDDHPMVRERLTLMIDPEPDLQACGEASDVMESLEAIERLSPDIVILDLNLRASRGLDLIKDLRARNIKVPVLVLSMHSEELYAERALKAGAMGYLSKQESTETILIAIRKVLSGEVHLSPQFSAKLIKLIVGGDGTTDESPVSTLADRELEVFQAIGRGMGTREIAEALKISIKTVETHKARIKEKLNARNHVQLQQQAIQWTKEYEGGNSA